ncbi:urease subunit gamma [Marinitenerispora sediminis]|uniref:urease n=1 Tax=Marinitenerispora sediminis TaxID=1931232 RepID=A0A368T5K7_9ACTN|nr:urease subunit gamma [Marinitenerispora sediminis]RCV53090.1 urease subunit beta [Marinitenerispora sediminis]RCV58544.1 urease subunit beta [Marinitenerispora sediminis]RCV58667.1 urease subunit beta [Marinitenerispora sediminis]
MFLTPSDTEKLLLSVAGMVARDRLERWVRLNHAEAVALLSCWILERAREGWTVKKIMDEGVHVLRPEQVMDGVPSMIEYVQVEATFPDGRKLVTLNHPIRPKVSTTDPAATAYATDLEPGEIRYGDGDVTLNAGREQRAVVVRNDGDRPVQIGSHIHLAAVNAAVTIHEETADGELVPTSVEGFRLDIAAGTSVRFQPGDEKKLPIVALGGRRYVPGIQIPPPEGTAAADGTDERGTDGE